MSDIIKILPDAIANQIAAGEVVQRPASIVKELLENSIDAGATHINLIIKDGGTTLIQVIDNGKGMSVTDARLCWERHATSKINNAADLFKLNTLGFRGEALASIASVAQVEMRTRRESDTVGTHIVIEGSEVKSQLPVQHNVGTSISVKNIFYNVPARRNFLKSPSVESRHIIEEFIRVAIPHYNVAFEMHNNGNEVFNLRPKSQAARLSELMNLKSTEELIYEEELSPTADIRVFLGVPETARKTRGDQYLFANGRFIKSPYFNHAVVNAYEDIIPKESFPPYCIFINIDPGKIDVNVHPTKTEVKFEDDKYIYHLIQSLCKRALHQKLALNFLPATDSNDAIGDMIRKAEYKPSYEPVKVKGNGGYNPFEKTANPEKKFSGKWMEILQPDPLSNQLFQKHEVPQHAEAPSEERSEEVLSFINWENKYLVFTTQRGLFIADRHNAHERVLFEKFYRSINGKQFPSQQLLFPRAIEMTAQEMILLDEVQDDLRKIGFDLAPFGKNTVVVNGLPASLQQGDIEAILKKTLGDYRETQQRLRGSSHETLAGLMAREYATRPGLEIPEKEAIRICLDLLACEQPSITPSGKAVFITFAPQDLEKKFQ